jgi:hypothetical protein
MSSCYTIHLTLSYITVGRRGCVQTVRFLNNRTLLTYGAAGENRPIFVESDAFLYNLGDPWPWDNIGFTQNLSDSIIEWIILKITTVTPASHMFSTIVREVIKQWFTPILSESNIIPGPRRPYITATTWSQKSMRAWFLSMEFSTDGIYRN